MIPGPTPANAPTDGPAPALALSVAQGLRLAGTRAADAEGRPLVLHHGTLHRFEAFGRTRDIGFHFGSRAQARARLAQLTPAERKAPNAGAPRIVSAAIAARNPVVLPDDPVAWTGGHVAALFRRFLTRPERLGIQAREASRDPVDEREAAVRAIVRAALQRAGHDSVVYRNVIERERRGGLEWSWLALDPGAVLILGEDLAQPVAALPPGIDPRPGIRPEETVRDLGGLRRRNCELARMPDVRRLVALARAAVGRADADCVLSRRDADREDWEGRIGTPDGEIRVEIMGRAGRLRIRPPRQDPGVDRLAGLAAEGLLTQVLGMPPGSYLHSGSWQPGEPVEAVVGEFEEALAAIAARLGPAPSAPMAG